jgi:predicted ATPase
VPEHCVEDLLERDAELAAFADSAELAREGAGSMLLIEGPAGIGKTRLVEAAIGQARAAGLVVASARSSELERDFPFGVVRQLLEPLVASAARGQGDYVFSGAANLGASILGDVRSDESWGARETYAALHGLYWLTSNIAARNPLAIAVDDVHWADAPSLRFLAFLKADRRSPDPRRAC